MCDEQVAHGAAEPAGEARDEIEQIGNDMARLVEQALTLGIRVAAGQARKRAQELTDGGIFSAALALKELAEDLDLRAAAMRQHVSTGGVS